MSLSRVKVWSLNETLTSADLNAEFNNIINNSTDLISPLSAALDLDGFGCIVDETGVTSFTSTSAIGWSFTPGSKSGTPSTTGNVANWGSSTFTDSSTAGSGTATAWVGHAIQQPTLAATNSSVTTTNAATLYLAGPPTAGANQTLTNAWALWVDTGHVRFDSDIYWLSGTAFMASMEHNNSANRTYTFGDVSGTVFTDGGTGLASQADQETATSTAKWVSPGNQRYHPGAGKGWAVVTFSGATPSLATSYNVTGITDSGTGLTTVTWDTDFSSANYAAGASFEHTSGNTASIYLTSKAAGSCVVHTNAAGTPTDLNFSILAMGDHA